MPKYEFDVVKTSKAKVTVVADSLEQAQILLPEETKKAIWSEELHVDQVNEVDFS